MKIILFYLCLEGIDYRFNYNCITLCVEVPDLQVYLDLYYSIFQVTDYRFIAIGSFHVISTNASHLNTLIFFNHMFLIYLME